MCVPERYKLMSNPVQAGSKLKSQNTGLGRKIERLPNLPSAFRNYEEPIALVGAAALTNPLPMKIWPDWLSS